jgi:two-component system NarL family response regulator
LADDHVPIRVGTRLTLEAAGFTVVAEAASGDSAVRAALRHRPAVCLLEVRLPGGGIIAAQRILERAPQTKVVMLTVSESPDDLLAALRAGADGYLFKSADSGRLPIALRAILAGETTIPRALTAHVVNEMRARNRLQRLSVAGRSVNLTERELEVLNLLRRGLSSGEIANRLGVSPVTVRRHLSLALKKLGARDRQSALELLNTGTTSSDGDLAGAA